MLQSFLLTLFMVLQAASLVLSSAIAAPATIGCIPPMPDNWFTAELDLEKAQIAPGVEIVPIPGDSPLLEVRNTTSTPLYILQPSTAAGSSKNPPDPDLVVPDGMFTEVKIEDNQVFVLNLRNHWLPIALIGPNEWSRIGEGKDQLRVRIDSQLFPSISKPIQAGDNRPANVAVPPPEQYDLTVVYGQKLIKAPLITKTYRLNPNYDPNKEANEQERCDQAGLGLVLVIVAIEYVPMIALALLIMAAMTFVLLRLLAKQR